jgi:hypothetical protein
MWRGGCDSRLQLRELVGGMIFGSSDAGFVHPFIL